MEIDDIPYLIIGAMVSAGEEAKKAVDDIVKRGKRGSKEASSMVEDIIKKGKKQQEEASEKIGEEIRNVGNKLGLVTKKDIKDLELKIANLEKRISRK